MDHIGVHIQLFHIPMWSKTGLKGLVGPKFRNLRGSGRFKISFQKCCLRNILYSPLVWSSLTSLLSANSCLYDNMILEGAMDLEAPPPSNDSHFVPMERDEKKLRCTSCNSTWSKLTLTTAAKSGHLSNPACAKYVQIKCCANVDSRVSARNVAQIESNMKDKQKRLRFFDAKTSSDESQVAHRASAILSNSFTSGRQVIFHLF